MKELKICKKCQGHPRPESKVNYWKDKDGRSHASFRFRQTTARNRRLVKARRKPYKRYTWKTLEKGKSYRCKHCGAVKRVRLAA